MIEVTESELIENFSQNLSLLRHKRIPPVTQQQLALRLHVGRGLIAKYEGGILLPPVCLAFNMARYFNVTMEDLFADWDS